MGDERYLGKEKTLFWVLKWTTGELYNLPNYFCQGLLFTNEMLYFVIAIISSEQESDSFL